MKVKCNYLLKNSSRENELKKIAKYGIDKRHIKEIWLPVQQLIMHSIIFILGSIFT